MTSEMQTETFNTTSGKEITVYLTHEGEPHSISWTDGEGRHQLTENEVFDIYAHLTGDDDDDEDEDDEDNDS